MEVFTDFKDGQIAETAKAFLLNMKLLKEFDAFTTEQKGFIMHLLGVKNPSSDVEREKYVTWFNTTRKSILKAIVLSSDAFSKTIASE